MNTKKKHLIAYLLFFESDHPELIFVNDIKLKKLSSKEKQYLFDNDELLIGSISRGL